MPSDVARDSGPIAVAVSAGIAHLVIGLFYLASGLVAPLWAVIVLGVWWVVLAIVLVRMAVRRSWWTPVIPLIALGTWYLALSLGENVLGWTG